MKRAFCFGLVILGSWAVEAKTLICLSDEVAWAQVKISGAGEKSISIEILETTPNRRADLGSVAYLDYVRTVKPRGRTFFNYQGKFVGGRPQKSWSVYLSEDQKTLTVFGSGQPYDYSCE